MNDIKQIFLNFDKNINNIDKLINIGSEMEEIIIFNLKELKKDLDAIPALLDFKRKYNGLIDQMNDLQGHHNLERNYEIIYNQAVVLLTSYFEFLLSQVFINLINYYIDLINWPDKKNVKFNPNILKVSNPTIGEITYANMKGEINFQDLKSTIDFFNNYLKIVMKIDVELKDNIILAHSFRHIIIHNNSHIDDDFLMQVRDTKYAKRYPKGTELKLKKDSYETIKKSFKKLSCIIYGLLEDKFSKIYGEEFVI